MCKVKGSQTDIIQATAFQGRRDNKPRVMTYGAASCYELQETDTSKPRPTPEGANSRLQCKMSDATESVTQAKAKPKALTARSLQRKALHNLAFPYILLI